MHKTILTILALIAVLVLTEAAAAQSWPGDNSKDVFSRRYRGADEVRDDDGRGRGRDDHDDHDDHNDESGHSGGGSHESGGNSSGSNSGKGSGDDKSNGGGVPDDPDQRFGK